MDGSSPMGGLYQTTYAFRFYSWHCRESGHVKSADSYRFPMVVSVRFSTGERVDSVRNKFWLPDH